MRLNALVLDLAILGPTGWSYLEQVCARLPGLAVVVCTGPSSVAQRVRGLRLGADAWITKPCHAEELICVIEAAVRRHRRAEMPALDAAASFGEITIRPDLYQAYVNEVSLELTAREFEILHLLTGSDRVLRREEIYERVWGYAMAHGDRSVDVFVRKLRQKLRSASPVVELHPHALRGRLPLRARARAREQRRGGTRPDHLRADLARTSWTRPSRADGGRRSPARRRRRSQLIHTLVTS